MKQNPKSGGNTINTDTNKMANITNIFIVVSDKKHNPYYWRSESDAYDEEMAYEE